MPELRFEVEKAEVEPFASEALLVFKLRVRQGAPIVPIQAVVLRCEIHIKPPNGPSVLWTHTGAVLPPFMEEVTATLPALCPFDFNVAAPRYFPAGEESEAPLTLRFSGTVLYEEEGAGLRASPVVGGPEASFRLPARVWKDMMDRYYPNSSWLCLRRDVFDRLSRCKSRLGLPTWEQTLEGLLPPEGPRTP